MKTTYISHPKAITPIREPIHDTWKLTCFDREVIDSAYFQRLHFVLQNSTTYAAYPSNKNSRFVHSVGVGGVAGQILVKALSNANSNDLKAFLTEVGDFITDQKEWSSDEKYYDNLIDGWNTTIYGQSGFAHCPFIKEPADSKHLSWTQTHDKKNKFETGFIVDTLWQSLRLCGLVHDIGHLPMSHSFEGAIHKTTNLMDLYKDEAPDSAALDDVKKQYSSLTVSGVNDKLVDDHSALVRKELGLSVDEFKEFLTARIEIHERRSLVAFEYIFRDDKFQHNGGGVAQEYRNLLFKIAFLILYASATDKARSQDEANTAASKCPAFLRVLKTIVASELDADRMDYTIRDGYSCGSPIGQFDLTRVLDYSVLVRSEGRFYIAHHMRALSGIEQFFIQRQHGYEHLIYHRTSSRSEACLQELIARLIHVSFLRQTSGLTSILIDSGYFERNDSGKIDSLLPYDREYMESIDDSNLRSLLFRVKRYLSGAGAGAGGLPVKLVWPIISLIDIVIRRDYCCIWNPFKSEPIRQSLDLENSHGKKYIHILLELGSANSVFEHDLKEKVRVKYNDEVVLIFNLQYPKLYLAEKVKLDDLLYILQDSGRLSLVENHSHALANMSGARQDSIGINVYAVSKDIKNNPKLQTSIRAFLLEEMIKWLDDFESIITEDSANVS